MSGLEWVGIALSLAKVVESLAETLISGLNDTAKFGPDLEKTRLALSIEASNFRSLKAVLFGRQENIAPTSPNSGARGLARTSTNPAVGLFHDLDPRTQLDIINVLRHFRESLESQYQIVQGRYGSSQPNLQEVTESSLPFGSYHTASLLRRVRWGFGEKGKIDKAVKELQCWNERLHRMVQIRLIQSELDARVTAGEPSTLFQKMQMSGLVGDMDSLGLADDIELAKISTGTTISAAGPLKMDDKTCKRYEVARVLMQSASRQLVFVDGWYVLLEFKEYDAAEQGKPSEAAEKRIGCLVAMLRQIKATRYRALQCSGYYWRNGEFVLTFPLPASITPSYTTLISMLQQPKVPSLEDRFILARTICGAVAQLHTVGWIHKSIRSENILFFKASDDRKRSGHLDNLYLSGWDYSRPETGFSSKPILSDEIAENVYRHPEQWGLPTVKFSRVHDIYSLGVVLLEIGRWKPALGFHHNKFSNIESGRFVRNRLVESANDHKMLSSMGSRYQMVVLKCLQWDCFCARRWNSGDAMAVTGPASNAPDGSDILDFQTEVLDPLDDIVAHL